jgi:hypothetical protein
MKIKRTRIIFLFIIMSLVIVDYIYSDDSVTWKYETEIDAYFKVYYIDDSAVDNNVHQVVLNITTGTDQDEGGSTPFSIELTTPYRTITNPSSADDDTNYWYEFEEIGTDTGNYQLRMRRNDGSGGNGIFSTTENFKLTLTNIELNTTDYNVTVEIQSRTLADYISSGSLTGNGVDINNPLLWWSKTNIPVAFTVVQINSTEQHNIHQIKLNFNINATQNTSFQFEIYPPDHTSATDTIYLSQIQGGGWQSDVSDTYGGTYQVAIQEPVADSGNFDIEIRKYPLTGSAMGVFNNTTPQQWVIDVKNITLNSTTPSVSANIGGKTRRIYNYYSYQAFINDGLEFDRPPAPKILSPADDLTVHAVDSATTDYNESFSAYCGNDDDDFGAPGHPATYEWSYVSGTLSGTDYPANPPFDSTYNCNKGVVSTATFTVTEVLIDRPDPNPDIIQTGSAGVEVLVKDYPAADIISPSETAITLGDAHLNVGFSGTGSGNDPRDPSDTALTHEWMVTYANASDSPGTASVGITGANTFSPTFDFKEPGEYIVSLTTGDQYGNSSELELRTVHVRSVEEMMFPGHIGLPRTPQADKFPTVDGVLENDHGWTGAYALTYNEETNTDVTFQAIRHNSDPKIYLSFEVVDAVSNTTGDFIVIGLYPNDITSTPSAVSILNIRYIVYYPHKSTPAERINVYKYDSGSSVWVELEGTSGTPCGITTDVDTGTAGKWIVEMEIPSQPVGGSDWITLGDPFLFYFNTHVTEPTDGFNGAPQYYWPKALRHVEFVDDFSPSDDLNKIFTPLVWGKANIVGAGGCTGIAIIPSHIGVRIPPSTSYGNTIVPETENEFVARITNDTFVINEACDPSLSPTDPASCYKSAEGVRVRFKLANWHDVLGTGIGMNWVTIDENNSECSPVYNPPSDSYTKNPTCRYTIPADDEKEFFFKWTAPSFPGNVEKHQCMKVEIESDKDVYIKKQSAWTNMDFQAPSSGGSGGGAGSGFIGTNGFRSIPKGLQKYRIMLKIETKIWDDIAPRGKKGYDKKEKELIGYDKAIENQRGYKYYKQSSIPLPIPDTNKLVSYYSWIVKGYIDTGKDVAAVGKKYKTLELAGSFGFVFRHDGPVNGWEYSIEGAKKISNNCYELEVAPGEVKEISYEVKPIEPLGLCASLHGGVSIPLTRFANDYGMGWNVIADIGYKVFPNVYLMGLFGYNWFPATTSGVDDTSILNISLNAKYYIPLLQPFLELGIGAGLEMYIRDMDFSQIDVGYNVDVSLDYKVINSIVLEVGAIYHSHFSEEYWFIQVHGGLLFMF